MTYSYREVEEKVAELRSQSLDDIALIVLDLEREKENLEDQVIELSRTIEDLESEQ